MDSFTRQRSGHLRKCLPAIVVLCTIQIVTCLPMSPTFDIWADENPINTPIQPSGVNESSLRQSKVLNFFPVPVDDECLSNDGRRAGVCLNPYECRIQNGDPRGQCALGFGVCCIFTARCDMEVYNNITYIISPNFPALSRGSISCTHKIKKIDPEISQLRMDFLHFSVGQPNRQTGVCEGDVFMISGGKSPTMRMCGLNSGQHVYYDVENVIDPVTITMNFSKVNIDRMWEIKVSQIPFNRRAPAGCLQYHTGRTGLIQTMNFADNGRHLADQEYTICTRQEAGMCSIVYEPCDENSFKIGPNTEQNGGGGGAADQDTVINTLDDVGSGAGSLRFDEPRMCEDRIVMPCESEEFLRPGTVGPGYCDIAHCGGSLCGATDEPCRIESSATPFNIGIQFGPGARMESPEDNLGMCLKYEQQPCAV